MLLLYLRIWGRGGLIRWLKYTDIALLLLIALWFVATEFVLVFKCDPIHKAWDYDLPSGSCIRDYDIFLAQSIPTVILDVAALCLPMPLVWKLQLPQNEKFAFMGMFLMGGFVTVISIVRLAEATRTQYSTSDITWNFVTLGLWSDAEPAVGLLSACLPTYGILFKTAYRKAKGLSEDRSYPESFERSGFDLLDEGRGASTGAEPGHWRQQTIPEGTTRAESMPRPWKDAEVEVPKGAAIELRPYNHSRSN